MPSKSFQRAILATLTLIFMAACNEQPTGIGAPDVGDLAFATIGDPGVTDGVPLTPTSVDHAVAFPSTNAANISNGWANVTWNADDAGLGEAPLKFTQPRNFAACFEVRIDDEPPANDPHLYWPERYLDGSWEIRCVGGSYGAGPIEETFTATSHVDVRLTLGAEGDERFDWTRFYVMSVESKDECRNGGWQALGFANQGQCIRYVETGKQ